jgi:hypothetical protein
MPKEDKATKYKIPKFISAKTTPILNGITPQPTKLNNNVSKGAKKKKKLLALCGIKISFKNNLRPSARGCKTPHQPTTIGPWRF